MNNWTEKETIVAFNLYCKLPFGKLNQNNPEIIHLAHLLGRKPSAVSMKLCNIARLDPSLQERGVSGLSHGATLEKTVWDKFVDNPDNLAFESEKLIAEFSHRNIEEIAGLDIQNFPEGKDRESTVKVRVNQSFFRDVVLNSYNHSCCISGIENDKLLEACHIVDWSDDVKNRTNPRNGLCLNVFFHKAYDQLLIAINPDLKISISEELLVTTHDEKFQKYLSLIDGQTIITPSKFAPNRDFLDTHYQKYLNR